MPPKKRSRSGCHTCKQARVKCDELKPKCGQCTKFNKPCDYTIKLKWGGRPYKKPRVSKVQQHMMQVQAVDDEPVRKVPQGQLTFQIETPAMIQSADLELASSAHVAAIKDEAVSSKPANSGVGVKIEPGLHDDLLLATSSLTNSSSNAAAVGGGPPLTPVTLSIIDDLLTTEIDEWSNLSIPDHLNLDSNISSANSNSDTVSPNNFMSLNLDNWSSNKPQSGMLISRPFIDQASSLAIHMSPSSSIEEMEIESIPRGLAPLPDILLNVPFYYESFKFYMDSTTSILTPADNSIYVDNPFKIVLPKLAMANDGLMSLLIAFGICHKAALENDKSKDLIVESLINRTLKELFKLLSNPETSTSDLTLALVMMLSSFTVFSFHFHWKLHMKGAKQIFLDRGYNKPFNKLLNDSSLNSHGNSSMRQKLLYFLIRWFAYIDIFTDLSSPLLPTIEELKKFDYVNYNDPNFVIDLTNDKMDYQFPEDTDKTSSLISLESHQSIDYMLGFNLKILPILSQLCSLIKIVNILKIKNPALNLPLDINRQALEIQQKLNEYQYPIFLTSKTPHYTSINHLIASNQCFILMGTLQLYTRVLHLDRNSSLIQSICSKMKLLIESYIDTKIPNSITLILPMFIAGCESIDPNLRSFWWEKLGDLKSRGGINAEVAMNLMNGCWKAQDLKNQNPDKDYSNFLTDDSKWWVRSNNLTNPVVFL